MARTNTVDQERFISSLTTSGALDAGSGFDANFHVGETFEQYAARLEAWKAARAAGTVQTMSASGMVSVPTPLQGAGALTLSSPSDGIISGSGPSSSGPRLAYSSSGATAGDGGAATTVAKAATTIPIWIWLVAGLGAYLAFSEK